MRPVPHWVYQLLYIYYHRKMAFSHKSLKRLEVRLAAAEKRPMDMIGGGGNVPLVRNIVCGLNQCRIPPSLLHIASLSKQQLVQTAV